MKTILFYLISFFYFTSLFSQNNVSDFPEIPPNNRIVFIGETHRILENYQLEFELIKRYIVHNHYNGILLECPSSYQAMFDKMIKSGDTLGLHRLEPRIICTDEGCVHNFNPVLRYKIKLAALARQYHIPIYCIDKEADYMDTRQNILSIVKYNYQDNYVGMNYFDTLHNTIKNQEDIYNSILYLFEIRRKWKNEVSKKAYRYIYTIMKNIQEQNINGFNVGRFSNLNQRDIYLFNKTNRLLKKNKSLKLVAPFGRSHSRKVYTDTIKTQDISIPLYSFGTYLNMDKKSVAKGKVMSIALIYFFNTTKDSLFTTSGYFNHNDLSVLYDRLGESKLYTSKTSKLPINSYIQKAFDYVIAINDCHTLFDHTRVYYKVNPKLFQDEK